MSKKETKAAKAEETKAEKFVVIIPFKSKEGKVYQKDEEVKDLGAERLKGLEARKIVKKA